MLSTAPRDFIIIHLICILCNVFLKNMQVYTPERIGKLRDGADRDMNFRLSACDAIIRAHDGSITAESAPGGGNIFRFTLRLEAADNGQ